jgi:hypothetical protein
MPDSKKPDAVKTAQAVTNYETMQHIAKVRHYIDLILMDLLKRGEAHDATKMTPDEVDYFVEYTPKLKSCTYDSDEYKRHLAAMKPALDHHYANNRHHPEHFAHGVSDMDLVDLIEMFCDWKAASLRQANGNLLKSIEHNASRFEISPQLQRILENTAKRYGE